MTTPTAALPAIGAAIGGAATSGATACTGRTAPPRAFSGAGVALMGRPISIAFAPSFGDPPDFGNVRAREFQPAEGLVLAVLRAGSTGS